MRAARGPGRCASLHHAPPLLRPQRVEFVLNRAEDKARREGAGGAIALAERCSAGEGGASAAAAAECAPVSANMTEVRCSSNWAYAAGGALSYEGRHPASSLAVRCGVTETAGDGSVCGRLAGCRQACVAGPRRLPARCASTAARASAHALTPFPRHRRRPLAAAPSSAATGSAGRRWRRARAAPCTSPAPTPASSGPSSTRRAGRGRPARVRACRLADGDTPPAMPAGTPGAPTHTLGCPPTLPRPSLPRRSELGLLRRRAVRGRGPEPGRGPHGAQLLPERRAGGADRLLVRRGRSVGERTWLAWRGCRSAPAAVPPSPPPLRACSPARLLRLAGCAASRRRARWTARCAWAGRRRPWPQRCCAWTLVGGGWVWVVLAGGQRTGGRVARG